MKKLLIAAIVLASCNNRNDKMTELLNQQKEVKEQISDAGYKESQFTEKVKATRDTTLIDSVTYYYMQGHRLKERAKEIQYSIDSLEKMN